jgi:hypothetical protein
MQEQKEHKAETRTDYPEISNIGIHTGRYNSIGRDSDGSFFIPIGCQLRR